MATPKNEQSWTFRSDGLLPDSDTSVFILSEAALENRGELDQFRREFPGIEPTFSDKRVRELFLGRKCAQSAIREKFGIETGWLPIGEHGMPELPKGVRASLSHSTIDGVAVAAVALAKEPEIVGIDVEPILPPETAKKLERRFAEHLPREERTPEGITELFTIYETVVKIASQMGHGKPAPSQIELIERSTHEGHRHWMARLNTDRLDVVSGIFIPAFPHEFGRLCLGWWDRKRSRS